MMLLYPSMLGHSNCSCPTGNWYLTFFLGRTLFIPPHPPRSWNPSCLTPLHHPLHISMLLQYIQGPVSDVLYDCFPTVLSWCKVYV